jgi:hypothetical protein
LKVEVTVPDGASNVFVSTALDVSGFVTICAASASIALPDGAVLLANGVLVATAVGVAGTGVGVLTTVDAGVLATLVGTELVVAVLLGLNMDVATSETTTPMTTTSATMPTTIPQGVFLAGFCPYPGRPGYGDLALALL